MDSKSFKYLAIFLGTIMFYNGFVLSQERAFVVEHKACELPGENDRSEAFEIEADEFIYYTSAHSMTNSDLSDLHLHYNQDLSDYNFEPNSPPPELV